MNRVALLALTLAGCYSSHDSGIRPTVPDSRIPPVIPRSDAGAPAEDARIDRTVVDAEPPPVDAMPPPVDAPPIEVGACTTVAEGAIELFIEAPCHHARATTWGAGGGGGTGAAGGAGGYGSVVFMVQPGDRIATEYGRGGEGKPGFAGAGGGASFVVRNMEPMVIAGGGGGAAADGCSGCIMGGAGGAGGGDVAENGQDMFSSDGRSATGGQGGNPMSGGAGGIGASGEGFAGELFHGGSGFGYAGGFVLGGQEQLGGTTEGTNGCGGSGGAGFLGGGGGGYVETYVGGGGGGGSGYLSPNIVSGELVAGVGRSPPLPDHPLYRPPVGDGGGPGTSGSDGWITLELCCE